MSVSGAYDFANAYLFRGIRQETEGLIMQPYLDVGLTLYEGEGNLSSFGVNFGIWNSLHSGSPSGTDNPRNQKLWYESDFYASVSLATPTGVSMALSYTAYTSPNDSFTSVKEVGIKFAWDDTERYGARALSPYGLVAFEVDTSDGVGQADGGLFWGTYMELGIRPGYAAPWFEVSVPFKVGLSLSDYYESPLDGFDDTFGFASLAGIVTVPFTSMPTRLGTWNVHGGVEVLKLNRTTRHFLNDVGDDGQFESWKGIYTVGLGFTY